MHYVVGKPHILNRDLFLKRIEDILSSKQFSNNATYVNELEEFIEDWLQVGHCVVINNATSALDICLAYLKTKNPFGQVIVPSFTFISTVSSVIRAGFDPVFADIDDDYTYNEDSLKSRINSQTVAIIPANLFGNYNNPELLPEYRGIFRLNDSAHALGVCLDNGYEAIYAGNFGDCEVFSGHPSKIFGAMEGGLITTNNQELADFAIRYRNFGFNPAAVSPQGELVQIGTNFKMNEVSAAAWLTQIEQSEAILSHYFDIFKTYIDNLPGWVKIQQPNVYFSNFSYIPCRIHPSLRDRLLDYLFEKGILARTYFQPVHKFKPFIEKYGHISLPNTERISDQIFCLPTGLTISPADVVKICNVIEEFTKDER